MKKKIISLIMTMVLCFCMLPTTAFATTEDYTISNALFVSAGTLGISQDMLQWSNVNAPGGYKLEIYTESETQIYAGTLTNNYTPASEVLTSSG
ncbi:MAG: hypothetical protein LUI15_04185, partial [Firmicutes bacterium]|nr:hypothetical protein [Bacillota bacterium]